MHRPSTSLIAAALGLLAGNARAQCSLQTLPGFNTGWFYDLVQTLTELPNGDLVVGGAIGPIGGVAMNEISRWNGSSWVPLGTGLGIGSMSGAFVHVVEGMTNGDLVVGGSFTRAGNVAADGIARWDGTSWSAMGAGLSDPPYFSAALAIAELPNGDLVAGGGFSQSGTQPLANIARWDGTNWLPLGSGLDDVPTAVAAMPTGDVIAGGRFTTAGGNPAARIARWDGTSWSPLGSGMNDVVDDLLVLPNGDLIAVGAFTTAGGVPANRVARWDGSSWSALGAGFDDRVHAMDRLSDGGIVVVGRFTMAGGAPANRIARWDGTNWSAFWSGSPFLWDVVALRSGGFAYGGRGAAFTILQALLPTCPALALGAGTGCSGSAGLNELVAQNLPWAGSTFRASARGLTNNSVALLVTGLSTTSVPLSLLLPQGVAGCSQFVTADAVQLFVPVGGAFDTQLAIPNSLALAGVGLNQQVLAAELNAQNVITAVTSTNALALTIGAL